MIRRVLGTLELREDGPEAARQLETEGHAVVRDVFTATEVATLRRELGRRFEQPPRIRVPGRTDADYADFRHEALNHSAAAQRAVGHPRILEVIEPLLGDDCHVIANTIWRNPARDPRARHGGPWHTDAGPHVPRPEGVPWDDRIPYPVFAIGAHVLLRDCRREDGPTGVLPGSHRSGRLPPRTGSRLGVTYEGRSPVALTGAAGDVALFVSDAWHRRLPPLPGDRGRFFLQVHYGRRDIAQRLRLTDEAHHLTPDAVGRARTDRERRLVGLHPPGFYDA